MSWVVYLLKVNLALILCWAVYRIAFNGLTFFRWNRYYLLGTVILSFILPLMNFQTTDRLTIATDFNGIDWAYVDHLATSSLDRPGGAGGFKIGLLILALYISVTLVFMVRSLFRIGSLGEVISQAHILTEGKVKIFVQDVHPGSFTLFRRIYLDRHAYSNQLMHVYRHEMVHATQLHSLDLLIMEFVQMIMWFNPFISLLKKSVRENHEFLADAPARFNQESLVDYLVCLRAETIRNHAPAMASYFKNSTIKKRIIMLTNHHSGNHKKWRYFLLLPLLALLTLAFQAPVEQTKFDPDNQLKFLPAKSGEEIESDGIPSEFPLPEKYKGEITWGYGQTAIHPFTKKETTHLGQDISAPLGTAVFAAADGIVIKAGIFEGWGKLIVLQHEGGFETAYAHLDQIEVETGKPVEKGMIIGKVGSSGQSTGPHLHYEVRKDGANVNPEDYY